MCSATEIARGGSDGSDRKLEDAGADSRRIIGIANLRDAPVNRVFGGGKRVDVGGNLRRAFAVCGLAAARVGHSQCGGRATKGHSQVNLRRRIPVNREWCAPRCSTGGCFVASAEIFPVRSAAQRSRDINRCGIVIRGSWALGVLRANAARGEGRSSGGFTLRVNRRSLYNEGVHVRCAKHGQIKS